MDTAVLMEIESLRRASYDGSTQEVSGGISGRDAVPASGAPVPADCLAYAGIG